MNTNETHENRENPYNSYNLCNSYNIDSLGCLDSLGGLREHPPRPSPAEPAPRAFEAVGRPDAAAERGLAPVLLNLVKIRAAQITHCALCLDMRSGDALAAGESAGRILRLGGWRESKHFYTAREIAAIELTEAITVLTDGSVPDEVYARVAAEFDESELAPLVAVITMLNGRNGFGVSTCLVPGHRAFAG